MVEASGPAPLVIRRLRGADAGPYRDLRLAGLRADPEAFGASWEEEEACPSDWFAARLDRNVVFGASIAGSPELAGTVGFSVMDGAKLRHKGVLWGMFVRREARGTGLGAALVTRVIEHAGACVEEIRLAVVTTNLAAIRLYERAGFTPYGLEPRALKVGRDDHDELLMALSLRRAGWSTIRLG